jgi:hypothetical protein
VAALLSYAIVPHLVTSGSKIPRYLFIEAALSTAATIFIFLFFRDSPPIPPSYSAAVPKMGFAKAFRKVARNKNFMIMAVTFSITVGTGISFSGKFICPWHTTYPL